jgi:pyruvate formate lyase activating enzyme
MDRCVETAQGAGLNNVYWSGSTGIPGRVIDGKPEVKEEYTSEGSRLAASYALSAGCRTHPRKCSTCTSNQKCEIKKYIPTRLT